MLMTAVFYGLCMFVLLFFFFGLRSQEGWFLNMRNEQVKNHLSYFQRKSFGNYVRTNQLMLFEKILEKNQHITSKLRKSIKM